MRMVIETHLSNDKLGVWLPVPVAANIQLFYIKVQKFDLKRLDH